MKSMQNEKDAKTSAETNKFKGRMVAKSEIIKTQWKYVILLTTTNRHVRQTIKHVMRAQRVKTEEINLN